MARTKYLNRVLEVYRIDGPSAEVDDDRANSAEEDGNNKCIRFNYRTNHDKSDCMTVGGMRRDVAERCGVPAENLRFYARVSWPVSGKLRFHSDEILRGDDGGELLHTRFAYYDYVGVVVLPAPANDEVGARIAPGRASAVEIDDVEVSGSDAGEDSGSRRQPKRTRRAKTETDSTSAGNDTGGRLAAAPARLWNEGGSGSGGGSAGTTGGDAAAGGESAAPRRATERSSAGVRALTVEGGLADEFRRAAASRRAADRSSSSGAGLADRRGGGTRADREARNKDGDGQGEDAALNPAAAAVDDTGGNNDGDATREQDAHGDGAEDEQEEVDDRPEDDEGQRAEARGEEDADMAPDNDAAAGAAAVLAGADNAGEAAPAAVAGPAAAGVGAPSELCSWLRGIDASGSGTGRFERYAPSFEREFDSRRDLVLAADHPSYGVQSILQVCGVERMGDKVGIEWAIGKLPRLE